MTCGACPEQYDAYVGGWKVGYLRLRHGHFTCRLWDPTGPVLYEAHTEGDGIFEPEERDLHINAALSALADRLGDRKETHEGR
jgi:hypothetical protein